jgi:hypothetical protein
MYLITKSYILYIIYMISQNRQSILLEKLHGHSRKSFTILLWAITKGYNKKFFYRTTLTYQQSVKIKQTVSLHPLESRRLCFNNNNNNI